MDRDQEGYYKFGAALHINELKYLRPEWDNADWTKFMGLHEDEIKQIASEEAYNWIEQFLMDEEDTDNVN